MLICLDIETTGYEPKDKICSVGILCFEDNIFVNSLYELVDEDKKIPSLASSIHNITNEMIAGKNSFVNSECYRFLIKHNAQDNSLLVHNASFVLMLLEASGLKWHGKIIDTQRVVKHHIPECELFSLSFLRYELKLYKREESLKRECGIKDALISHHALSDTLIIKLLFDYLQEEISIEKMYELTFANVLLEKFSFGKYLGRYIEEIAMNDRSYLLWMLSLDDLDDDLRYSLEYYLEG